MKNKKNNFNSRNLYQNLLIKSKSTKKLSQNKRELYDLAFAAFMTWDYKYAKQITSISKWQFPQDTLIYDIEILIFGESWEFSQALSVCDKRGLNSLVSFLVQGNIYSYRWKNKKAQYFFSEGLKKYPNNHILEYNYANFLYTSWDYKKAFEYYNKSIEHGDYLYAYCKKLKLFKIQGKKEDFTSLYRNIENKLQDIDAWDKDLIYGNLYYEKWKYIEALKKYKDYLSYRARDFYTLNAVWNCYYHLWKYSQALTYYKKSFSINNKIPYTANALLRTCIQNKKYIQALDLYKNISLVSSGNFMTYFLLWKIYFFLGKYYDSQINFLRSYELHSNYHMSVRYIKKLQNKAPIILPEFHFWNNIEFSFSQKNTFIPKVLYHSFWDIQTFKNKIKTFLYERDLLYDEEQAKLKKIFSLKKVKNKVFHFWTDINTWRYKFYISLYHTSFEESLKIISNIKAILNIQEKYLLEKNFLKFDCIWCDIKNGKLSLKIYELIKVNSVKNLPWYNVKEIWILKNFLWRKKVFYRLQDGHTIQSGDYHKKLLSLQLQLWKRYTLQKHLKYYCKEWEKEEIYFN